MENGKLKKTSQDSDSNFVPNPVMGDENSIIQGLYDKLCAYEYHYDILQNNSKNFSATWLLVGFIGISYIIKSYGLFNFFLESFELIFIINIITFGLYIQWFWDCGVYHRQLRAVFIANKNLENKYHFLGKSHNNMSLVLENKDPVSYHGKFYLSIIVSLVLISLIGIIPYIKKFQTNSFLENLELSAALLFLITIHLFFNIILLKVTRKSGAEKLEKDLNSTL